MRLPFVPTSERTEVIYDIIHDVAQRADVTKHEAGVVMMTVFEQVAERFAQGKEVLLPGFGSFVIRDYVHPRTGVRCPRPDFVPAAALRSEVIRRCPIEAVDDIRVRRLIRRSQPSRSGPNGSSTKALGRCRDTLAAQGGPMTRYRIRQLRVVIYAQAQSPYFPALSDGHDGAPGFVDHGIFHRSQTLPRRRGRPTKDESLPWVDLKLVPEGKPAKKLIRQLGLRIGTQRIYGDHWNVIRKQLVDAGIRVIPVLLSTEENAQRIEAEKLAWVVDGNMRRMLSRWEQEDRTARRRFPRTRASAILEGHRTHTTEEEDRSHIEKVVQRATGKPFSLPNPDTPADASVVDQSQSTVQAGG
jgi:nucleoid DNA-binding protein